MSSKVSRKNAVNNIMDSSDYINKGSMQELLYNAIAKLRSDKSEKSVKLQNSIWGKEESPFFMVKACLEKGYMPDKEGNLSSFAVDTEEGSYKVSALDKLNMKRVFSETKFADINRDHNQALDMIEHAKEKGIEIPKTLITFDTHSDIYLCSKINGDASIASWINEYIANNDADDVYWVVPKEILEDETMQSNLDAPKSYGAFIGNHTDMEIDLKKDVLSQTFISDRKTGEIFFEETTFDATEVMVDGRARYKKVNIHTCASKNLPNFKGQDVILSIDADYVSNTGVDTVEHWRNNRKPDEINKECSSLLKTFKDKNIRPSLVNLTVSPGYTPDEDVKQMRQFYDEILKTTPQKTDVLTDYSRADDKPRNVEEKYRSY